MRILEMASIASLHASAALGGVVTRREDLESKHASLDKTWRQFTAEEFCTRYDPQKNLDDAERVWTDFGVGKWFDDWLEKTADVSQWAPDMDKEMHRNGQSQFYCDVLGDSCDPPSDCQLHYNNGMGPAYWILHSASRFHSILTTFKSSLEKAQDEQVLDVDKMIEDFGLNGGGPEINLFGILNGAFTIAAGVTAPVAAISGPLTVVAGAIGIAGSVGDAQYVTDPSIAYEDQVYQGYDSTIGAMESMAKTIFSPPVVSLKTPILLPGFAGITNPGPGGAIRNIGGEEIQSMPGLTGSNRQPLVRFFAEGKFLRNDWTGQLAEIQDAYVKRHRAAIAARMLKEAGFVVVVNSDMKDRGDCGGENHWWDGYNKRCFRTMRVVQGLQCNDGPQLRKDDDGRVQKAWMEYSLIPKDYYPNSYECAKKHPDGEGEPPKTGELGEDKLPECFFNMPVVEGSLSGWGGPGLKLSGEPSLNTLSETGCGQWTYNSGHLAGHLKPSDWEKFDGTYGREVDE